MMLCRRAAGYRCVICCLERRECKLGIKRVVLTILGFVLLGFGAIGVAIPVLPTTPFVLFAAICFSAGNSKLAKWLENTRVFGPYIKNYRTGQGVDLRLKIASIIFVWIGLAISIVSMQRIWATFLLIAIGIGVTIHLLMIKTKEK